MGLEEERLTWRERTEPTATTGLPEIDLRYLWPGGQKPVPRLVGYAHVRTHDNILHQGTPVPAPFLSVGRRSVIRCICRDASLERLVDAPVSVSRPGSGAHGEDRDGGDLFFGQVVPSRCRRAVGVVCTRSRISGTIVRGTGRTGRAARRQQTTAPTVASSRSELTVLRRSARPKSPSAQQRRVGDIKGLVSKCVAHLTVTGDIR